MDISTNQKTDNKKECSDNATDLLNSDFQKVYDVYLYSHQERNSAVKMSLTFFALPFVIVPTLFSINAIKVVPSKSGTAVALSEYISAIPPYLYLFILFCGIAGLIPLLRYIEAHCQNFKMIRALNNFRLYYVLHLNGSFKDMRWFPTISFDPEYPRTLSFEHWSFFWILTISLMNSLYICFGLYGFDKNNIVSLSGLFFFFGIFILQVTYFYKKSGGVGKNLTTPRCLDELERVYGRAGDNS